MTTQVVTTRPQPIKIQAALPGSPAGVASPHGGLAPAFVVSGNSAIDRLFVKCPRCGNTLAAVAGGCFVTKHRGREYVMDRPPVSIRCDLCPGVWRRPDQTDAELMGNVEAEIRERVETQR
jgi:hypothetical protein